MVEIMRTIKKFKVIIYNYFKNNKALVLILFLGAFFRLYKISEYMTFLGDEGRDVIIVRNLLVHADPILIGPGTSIGGMYLGPLYYYLIAVPLLLANFSPVGPAIFIALLGVATIWLIFKVGSEWFNKKVGLISALFYAFAPTAIVFSRSSWNPNIMPFFALLSTYSIWKFYISSNYKWLMVCAVSFAFVLQSHYLGLLLIPTILIFYFLKLKNVKLIRNWKLEIVKFKKYSLFSLGIFFILMSPLLIFDLRHDFMNARALHKFLTVRQETVSIKPWNAFDKIPGIFTEITSSLIFAKSKAITYWGSLVFGIGILYTAFKMRRKLDSEFYVLFLWIFAALIGLGLYKQHIYDHYFGFLFPAFYLMVGYLLSKLNKLLMILVTLLLLLLNLWSNPLRFHPNKQMQRSQNVANLIIEKSNNTPFNLAVLAERNYEDGYRYFLEKAGAKVLHADRWNKDSISNQLFVICEIQPAQAGEENPCDPTHSPKAEVANFGMTKIDQKWSVNGVIIYRLEHSI